MISIEMDRGMKIPGPRLGWEQELRNLGGLDFGISIEVIIYQIQSSTESNSNE